MIIIGLDLGSATGYSVVEVRERQLPPEQIYQVVAAGAFNIAPERGQSPGCRYINLAARLSDVARAWTPTHIAYEAAHHRGGAATEYAAGCVATVQAWCAARGVEHSSVHTATLKKSATGSGKASKEEMIAAALVECPNHLAETIRRSHDTADAVHVAVHVARKLYSARPAIGSR